MWKEYRALRLEVFEARICLAANLVRSELEMPLFGEPIGFVSKVGAADLDGDLDLDIFAVTIQDELTVSWLENRDGKSSFGRIQHLPRPEDLPLTVTAFDVDSDADRDLVYYDVDHGRIRWYRNDAARFELQPEELATNSGRVFSLDADADGKDELLHFSNGSMWMRKSNPNVDNFLETPIELGAAIDGLGTDVESRIVDLDGDGISEVVDASFRFDIDPRDEFSPSSVEADLFFDMDGDGDVDLVGGYSDVVVVAHNDGFGEFSSFQYSEILQRSISDGQPYASDFDGDGDGDILLVGTPVTTLLMNEGGGFNAIPVPEVPSSIEQRFLTIQDIDRDGDVDLLIGGADITFYENDLSVSGSFRPARSLLEVPFERPFGIDVTDVDKDGLAEIVTTGTQHVLAFPNQGDGFGNAIALAAFEEGPDNDRNRSVTLVDIDGDSDDDLLVSRFGELAVLTNNQQIEPFVRLPLSGVHGGGLTPFDMDGDGDDDFWYRRGVLLNEDGAFVNHLRRDPSFIENDTLATSVADFDGDGRLDVLDVRHEPGDHSSVGTVAIRYNRSGPELMSARDYWLLGHHAIDIHDGVPIDFDGDGDLDVAAIGSDVDRGELYLYENRGAVFGLPRRMSAAPSLTDIESIDLDRDGDFDLVLSDGIWFENDGQGGFTEARVDEPWYFDVIVRDLDSDGISEIVSWLPEQSRVFVHRIDLPDRVVGDSNGDGVFDSADLVMVFAANEYEDDVAGNSTWAEGDWDGDGDFTSSDLVAAFKAGTYRAEAILRTQVVDSLFKEASFALQDRSEGLRHRELALDLDPDLK